MKKRLLVMLTTGVLLLSATPASAEPICVWIPQGGPHGYWFCPIQGPQDPI